MTSSRWWEFYFIRYAMGTVVGGLVVVGLCHLDPDLHRALFGLGPRLHDSATQLLTASYGLVFCYIASIPILVLHAARTVFPLHLPAPVRRRSRQTVIKPRTKRLVTAAVGYLTMGGIAASAIGFLISPDLDTTIGKIAILVTESCILLPTLLITIALMHKDRAYIFSKRLARAREYQQDKGELISSYRHLREHGNSLFIVLLEGVLGVALIGAHQLANKLHQAGLLLPPQFYLYGVVTGFWILPGAMVWVFATALEREFVRDGEFSV